MLRKPLLIIFFITLLYQARAQELGRVSFGTSFYAEQAVPLFDATNLTDQNNSFGFRIAIDFYYDLNDRIQFNSGLLYKDLGLNYIDYSPLFPCDSEGDGSADAFSSWFNNEFQIRYLGLPFQVKYKLLGDANHLYIKPGFSLLFKLNDDKVTTVHSCGSPSYEIDASVAFDIKSSALSFNLGIGSELGLSKQIKFIIEPEFEYGITKFFNRAPDAISNSRFLSYGIRTGIRF